MPHARTGPSNCTFLLQASPPHPLTAGPPPPVLTLACRSCTALQELRLNHNQLRALPADLAANTRLRILDCGGNQIASFDDIQVGGRGQAGGVACVWRCGAVTPLPGLASVGCWSGVSLKHARTCTATETRCIRSTCMYARKPSWLAQLAVAPGLFSLATAPRLVPCQSDLQGRYRRWLSHARRRMIPLQHPLPAAPSLALPPMQLEQRPPAVASARRHCSPWSCSALLPPAGAVPPAAAAQRELQGLPHRGAARLQRAAAAAGAPAGDSRQCPHRRAASQAAAGRSGRRRSSAGRRGGRGR